MKPLSLTITNFGPFKGTQVFEFPRDPGLYFLWGDNREEPRLEANGAGKSKLWQALVWCIFGKTSNGLKAGDTANWEAGKGTEVRFGFCDDNGIPEFIVRTWGPISWTHHDLFGNVHDLAKDSNPFMARLKLEMAPFLNSVLMAQGEPLFLDLKAEAKAALFASVMNLDRWLDYSQKASKKAADQDVVSRRLERELAGFEAQLEQMDGAPLDDLFDDWEHARKKRRADIEAEYASLIERDDKIGRLLSDAEEAEAQSRARLKTLIAEADDARAALKDLTTASQAQVAEHARLNDRVEDAEERVKFWAEHDHCPTCLQDLTSDDKSAVRYDAENTLQDLAVQLDRLGDQMDASAKALKRGQEAREGAERAVARGQAQVDDSAARKREIARDKDRLSQRLDELEAQDEKVAAEINPYAALLDQQDAQRQDLRRARSQARRRLDDSDSQYRLLQGWVKWFKEIRLSLIAEALQQLEVEVNGRVNALGLVGWELNFEVDRETKSGSIQRGFNVFVQSPHNAKPAPWEAWSGGEGQRLRVAAQQGLGNLIRARTGATFDLEVWDEPTQWMSGQGVTDLLDSLAERAKTEQRQIWIVDHRSLGYGNFTGHSGVVKTKAGSHFDQSGLYISPHGQPQTTASDPPHDVRRPRTRTKR